MFDSVTPYNEIFKTEPDKKVLRKTVNKNNCFYEIEGDEENGYLINRVISTDPKVYLDKKLSPGQKFFK